MASNRAVVVDPNAAQRLVLQDVEMPKAQPAEALIAVKAISLNRGEVRGAATAAAGRRPGWDLAGIVEAEAANGTGPKKGDRVVGLLLTGAWAEHVAVPTHSLAKLPEGLSFAQAATLPVAGLTALHALRKDGPLLGRNVLITGVTGGVGYFAVQLAKMSGARVIAPVRKIEQINIARQAGADETPVVEDPNGIAPFGPFDYVLESVGGTSLTASLANLASGGTCVLFGTSGGNEVMFNASKFYGNGGRRTLYGFILFAELNVEPASVGLALLANLMVTGKLKVLIDAEMPLERVAEAAKALMDRKFAGKVVLTM